MLRVFQVTVTGTSFWMKDGATASTATRSAATTTTAPLVAVLFDSPEASATAFAESATTSTK